MAMVHRATLREIAAARRSEVGVRITGIYGENVIVSDS
jgi:hypothetical protein